MGEGEPPLCRLNIDIGKCCAIYSRSMIEQLSAVDIVRIETESVSDHANVAVMGVGASFLLEGLSDRGLATYCNTLRSTKRALEMFCASAEREAEQDDDDDTDVED